MVYIEVEGRCKGAEVLGRGAVAVETSLPPATVWLSFAPAPYKGSPLTMSPLTQVLDSKFLNQNCDTTNLFLLLSPDFQMLPLRSTFITPSLPANNIFSLQILALMTQDHNLL